MFVFKHATTGQECAFPDAEQAAGFISAVDSPDEWEQVAGEPVEPADEAQKPVAKPRVKK